MKNLYQNTSVKLLLAPTTAATGASTGDSVDMAGFDGALFIGTLGTIAAESVTLAIHQSSASTSGFAAISGASHTSSTGGESDCVQVIDVYRPAKRYLRPIVTRPSTDTAEYGGVVVIRYGARKVPTAHDSTSMSASTGVLVTGS